MRDASAPALAACLLGIAALASDGGPLGVPAAGAATATLLAFTTLLVVPSLSRPSVSAVATALLVALPFAVAADRATPSGLAWPLVVTALAALGGAVAARLPEGARRAGAAVLAVLLAAAPLADALGVPAPPRPTRAAVSALASRAGPVPARAPRAVDAARGTDVVREGALVPARVAAAAGLEVRGVEAPWVDVPVDTPGASGAGVVVVRVVGAALPPRTEGRFLVVSDPTLPRDARDLDGADVVLLVDGAGGDALAARALVSFVRRGGLLAGPALPASFGPELERLLGAARPSAEGARGAIPLGAGHVARTVAAHGLEELVGAGLATARYGTVLDRGAAPAAVPGARSSGGSGVPARLPARSIVWLGAFAVALLAVSRLGGLRSLLASGVLSALACGGLLATAGEAPPPRAEGFVIDAGGPGGRRLEILRLEAGPMGWRASAPLRSAEGIRRIGFDAEGEGDAGRLTLAPGGVGWLVTDSVATGRTDGTVPFAAPPDWALPFLRPAEGLRSGAGAGVVVRAGTTGFRGAVPEGIPRPARAPLLVVDPRRP